MHNRQSEPRAIALGGKERIEHAAQLLLVEPGTTVANLKLESLRSSVGVKNLLAAVLHGLHGVEHQIEHRPTKHLAIGT